MGDNIQMHAEVKAAQSAVRKSAQREGDVTRARFSGLSRSIFKASEMR